MPQTVAGAIAKRMRRGRPSTVNAAGAQAVHQAVKAVAIARKFLIDDNLDICAQLQNLGTSEFANNDGRKAQHPMLRFIISQYPMTYNSRCCEHPMKVAAVTEPSHTAGAIARDLRRNVSCSVSALGAESVYQCCKAIAQAHEFLVEDQLGFTFQPYFIDPDSNVLEFAINATAMPPQMAVPQHHHHHPASSSSTTGMMRLSRSPSSSPPLPQQQHRK
jgi:stage V sporulation protein S